MSARALCSGFRVQGNGHLMSLTGIDQRLLLITYSPMSALYRVGSRMKGWSEALWSSLPSKTGAFANPLK